MSVTIKRGILYKAIELLPDSLIPELAEFIFFLQLKAQQKITPYKLLSNQLNEESTDYLSGTSQPNLLNTAAQTLLTDYTEDKELTVFTQL
ncbi:hypothetical protein QUF64_14695 [Anaerolineales bacterium HSG6]|nr:hypothetical protein [Anaerolineales bacterium HSG6]